MRKENILDKTPPLLKYLFYPWWRNRDSKNPFFAPICHGGNWGTKGIKLAFLGRILPYLLYTIYQRRSNIRSCTRSYQMSILCWRHHQLDRSYRSNIGLSMKKRNNDEIKVIRVISFWSAWNLLASTQTETQAHPHTHTHTHTVREN